MATRTRHRRQSVGLGHALEAFARRVTEWAGSSWACSSAVGVIIIWALLGPFYAFSDTWQLVINTGTTIITFLMVFLIQNTQNRDSEAMQVKLDELIRVTKGAQNALLDLEELEEEELEVIRDKYEKIAERARGEFRKEESEKKAGKRA